MPAMHSYKVTRTITERVNASSMEDAITLTEIPLPSGTAWTTVTDVHGNQTTHVRKAVVVEIDCEDVDLH